MAFAEFMLVVFCVFYTRYFYQLLMNKQRKKIQKVNQEMNKLRKIPIKTLEEQKNFLDLRYPKMIGKFKFTYKKVVIIVLQLVIIVCVFKFYIYLIQLIHWNIKLWQVILLIMCVPMLINLILKKFNLQTKSDLSIMLKGWRK